MDLTRLGIRFYFDPPALDSPTITGPVTPLTVNCFTMARPFLAVVLAVTLLNLLCGLVCSFTPTTVSRARPSRSQPRSAYVGPRTAQNSNRSPSRAHSYPNQAPSSLLHLNRRPHTSSSFALAAITVDGPPTTFGNSFDIHKFGDEYSLWLDSFNGTSSSVLCHTSPNGLSFSPNPSSVDESASLSPNADDWWYFDTHSVSVGSVLPASTGDGKECLLMYYTGKDGSGRQRVGTAGERQQGAQRRARNTAVAFEIQLRY